MSWWINMLVEYCRDVYSNRRLKYAMMNLKEIYTSIQSFIDQFKDRGSRVMVDNKVQLGHFASDN